MYSYCSVEDYFGFFLAYCDLFDSIMWKMVLLFQKLSGNQSSFDVNFLLQFFLFSLSGGSVQFVFILMLSIQLDH